MGGVVTGGEADRPARGGDRAVAEPAERLARAHRHPDRAVAAVVVVAVDRDVVVAGLGGELGRGERPSAVDPDGAALVVAVVAVALGHAVVAGELAVLPAGGHLERGRRRRRARSAVPAEADHPARACDRAVCVPAEARAGRDRHAARTASSLVPSGADRDVVIVGLGGERGGGERAGGVDPDGAALVVAVVA